jgi:hypothetical protein
LQFTIFVTKLQFPVLWHLWQFLTELPDIFLVGKTRIWSGQPTALNTQGI